MIRVAGVRDDGAMWLMLDGGLSCILHNDCSSPAVDPTEVEKLGPWAEATGVDGARRRALAADLDKARIVSLDTMRRKFKFEYETSEIAPRSEKKPGAEKKAEAVIGDKPDENPDEQITEVGADGEPMPAKAKAPEKDAAKADEKKFPEAAKETATATGEKDRAAKSPMPNLWGK